MPDDGAPVLYAEAGSSWWPLGWGPLLAAVGLLVELASGGAVELWVWLPLAVLSVLVSAVWVSARRRLREVRLTPATLRQGREELAVELIAGVGDVGTSMGAPVLGGSWLVPNGTDGVPLRLTDGRSVLAWARDADALAAALRPLVHSDSEAG